MKSHILRLSGTAGLTLLALLLAPVSLVQAAFAWQIETVDATGEVGWYTSLVLDSDGRPHISYYDVTNEDLKYATYDGTAWQVETVDAEGWVGLAPSLALDSSGQPHISYYDETNDDLKYAAFDGTAWQIETVDAQGWVGLYSSLALDGNGQPHISYYNHSHADLKYAAFDGTAWQIETVDAAGFAGLFTSLALDSSGQPHISYYDATNGNLKYATYDGTAWQTATVDAAGAVGWGTSLALDSDDQPHIGYQDFSNDNLKYATYDGTAWQIEIVDSKGSVGGDASLTLDRDGQPHIGYWDGTNDNLKYAAFDGTAWQIETVDAEGWVGSDTSLALDGDGQPHISYHDDTNGDLKYAQTELNEPPTSDAGGPYSGAEGSPVSLDATVTDLESDTLTTTWSYIIDSAAPGTTCTFGDANGAPSEPDTTLTCTDDGTFSVTLEASDGTNPAVTDTAAVTISNTAPTVTLGADVTINQGDAFTAAGSFSDSGSNDTHTATVNYGDAAGAVPLTLNANGSFSLGHTYTDDGQYTVEVCVTDDDQGAGCDEILVQVVNQPPTVEAGGPYSAVEGSPISLDGTVSDPESDDLTISWSYTVDSADPGATCTFTDASGAPSGPDTTFTCTDDGDFTVALTVTDGHNPPVIDTASVTISNIAPTVTQREDVEINSSDTYTDGGSFTDPGANDTHIATVNYGDGSGDQPLTLNDGSFSLSHTYLDHGQFTVEVCVTDDDGGQGCDELLVTVINQAPTVDAGGPYSGTEGSPISLNGVVSDPENDDLTTGWSYGYALGAVDPGVTCTFGDPSQLSTTITCSDDGRFSLKLSADDGANPAVSDFITISISNVAPTVTLGEDVEINEGEAFSAGGSFTDPGANDTHSATVDYGDGSGVQALALNAGGAFDLSHDYLADDGQYLVEVCVADDEGDQDCEDQLVTVLNVVPTITDIGVDVSGSEAALTVTATDPAGDNDPLSYSFDCDNDGGYDIGPQPKNSATCDFGSTEGSFTIGVQVSDGDGGVTTGEVAISVASNLCASNHTGVLRYSDACRSYETVVTIAGEGPVTICASNHNGLLREPLTSRCEAHEISYLLPEDGPLSVCVNGYTLVMRAVDDLSRCVDHEFGVVLAATEIEASTPPRSR